MKKKKFCSQIEIIISQMLIKFAKCERLTKVLCSNPWKLS
jgi:hypothetical protein